MRGVASLIAMLVAISGLLLIIAFGGSEAYLARVDDADDLNAALLLPSIAPPGWKAALSGRGRFSGQFVAPCLRTPLLDGVATSGRGATTFTPPGGTSQPVDLLIVQTSTSGARAIMDDVGRDTEDGCRRGIIVGTVDSASVVSGAVSSASRSVLVDYGSQDDGAARHYQVLFMEQETFVALLRVEAPEGSDGSSDDLVALAVNLVAQIDQPPTAAQLASAGVLDARPAMVQHIAQVNDAVVRVLTLSGQISALVGLAIVGGVSALLLFVGARLNRSPMSGPAAAMSLYRMPLSTTVSLPADSPKPERRWIEPAMDRAPEHVERDVLAMEPFPEDALPGETGRHERPVRLPPVIDFPQLPVEEKLMILKASRQEARKREHLALRDASPDVNWTDEISKRNAPGRPLRPEARLEPVSRNAIMRQLKTKTRPD